MAHAYYNGMPVTDGLLDLWNAVGGLEAAQGITIAAFERDPQSWMARWARKKAGYGGLERHTLTEADRCRA